MSKKKQSFKEIPVNFDFIDNEKKLLNWWYKSGLVKKYLAKNKGAKKIFSFMDGPITANNPMGVHHAWGRTLKDLYQKYKNMQGFEQRFQNGFDCQGLWVEVEVEKEKGFKNKNDIEDYGIGKFVDDCKARVNKYSQVQTEQSKRLGYFMDWDNSYYTMSDHNNYMIWSFLKKCHQEDNLYKGDDTVPWCPRCSTSISNQEIADGGHVQTTHTSVYLRFPVIDKDEYLMIWTTTPWTVPADTILAVSPEIKYSLVEFEGKKYWLAKKLIKAVFGQEIKPIKTVNGQQLIEDQKVEYYQAPFDDLPIIKKTAISKHFHQIVLSKDLVNQEEGTGVVHIVSGAGTEDNHLVKHVLGWHDLIFPVIDEVANYVDGYGFLTGKNAKNHPELVLDYLKNEKKEFFFKTANYSHPYPICWRCKTELVWRLVDEWYIKMDNPRKKDKKTLRQQMTTVAKKIKWLPGFGLKRELDWLKNMSDWMISKKRYYGLCLPIWECSCGHFEVIGSKEELKERTVKGWQEFEGQSPHRPQLDKVKIECPQCKKAVNRILDVGNPWLDAGIVNFSTLVDPKTKKLSYLTDKKYWQKWFPADFITEDFAGQFRNWFYALIAMSTVLEDCAPYKTVLGHGLVRDEKGEEMHKSAGNAIWFDDAAEKMGVDTMRWLYARQSPELNLNFGYKIADEVRRQFIFLYWNSYKFFITYAGLNGFQPSGNSKSQTLNPKLDKWILSRLESTKKTVEEKLDRFHHRDATKKIEEFLNDFSLWYIRRSRERINPNNKNNQDRNSCLETLYFCLEDLTLILSPFIPFLTETVWQGLHPEANQSADNSVHLQNWPKINTELVDQQLEKQMALVREVVTLGHAQRALNQLKVRQPLKTVNIYNLTFKIEGELIELIQDELNVKEVVIEKGTGELKIELDTKISPELKEEGDTRELIRQIQILRREEGLSLTDKITIQAPDWPKKWQKEILERTGAKEIKKAKELKIKKV